MTKIELLAGYKQMGMTLTVVKEEHSELGDIFYVSPTAKVSLKSLKATEEDMKIILGVKELQVLPDYEAKAVKVIVGNTNPKNPYAERKGISVVKNSLTVPLGATPTGVIAHTFTELPHLLVAGSTGSGKSFFLHQILASLVENNEHVSLVPIDFKGTELVMYSKFVTPMLGQGYGTTLNDAHVILGNAVYLMNHRYVEFKKLGVSDITAYNAKHEKKLDHIFIVVDELADIMLSYTADKLEETKLKAVKAYLIQLAQKARSAGIHLILSTQRPTVDVISGHIKANIISRIALKTSTAMESKVILDETGAEALGKGGFLYKAFDSLASGRSFKVDMAEIKATVDRVSYVASEEYAELRKAKMDDVSAETANRHVAGFLSMKELVLERVKLGETTAHDISVYVAERMGWEYSHAQYEVRLVLNYLENSKVVVCARDIGSKSTLINEEYLRKWVVRLSSPLPVKEEVQKDEVALGALLKAESLTVREKAELIKKVMFSKI